MIIEIIGIIIAVSLVVTAIILYNRYKEINVEKISFKEAFDLTDLPIITFRNGDNKLNFLLDTGSTDSHINKEVIDSGLVDYNLTDYGKEVFGMEGNKITIRIVEMTLTLNNNKFEEDFLVNDLSAAFGHIKAENGVTLHGILGVGFFDKYKYIIDFSQYVAYSKK